MSDNKYKSGGFADLRSGLTDASLTVVPLPPLISMLPYLEKEKGSPLTEEEVLSARDTNPAVIMEIEDAQRLAEKRGFDDLDPDNIWEDWQAFRLIINENDN